VATHFSRLLRHAWVTVGLFLFLGHYTRKQTITAYRIFTGKPKSEVPLKENIKIHLGEECENVNWFELGQDSM
jgi:hypothetical protein